MQEVIKTKVTRFEKRLVCEVCSRDTSVILGYDFDSDEEAMKHCSTHIEQGWWVGDGPDKIVCGLCTGRAAHVLRPAGRLIKGFTKQYHLLAEHALKHRLEFAKCELKKLEEIGWDELQGSKWESWYIRLKERVRQLRRNSYD